MSHKEQDLQKDIIRQIRNSSWCVKGHFHDLVKQLIPAELLQNKGITFVDELITEETIESILSKQYDNDGYVLSIYAHKTYTDLVSPFTGEIKASHISILLCKVEDGRINQVLNIDGYHSLNYMDIIGEREGATPNPYIRNRLVIDAPDKPKSAKKPLQSASWNNMNCTLYSFTIAKAILHAFSITPEILDELFVENGVSQSALMNLKDIILQGVEGTYVKLINGSYYRDPEAGMAFHKRVRETLAKTVQARFDEQNLQKNPVFEQIADTPKIDVDERPVSVTSSSMFKPATNEPVRAIDKLVGLCTAYQTHLCDELGKLSGKKPEEMVELVKNHIINEEEPDDLDKVIKKYRITNSMLDALQNPADADETKRIRNMNAVLTPENKTILAEHRSGGGQFLQSVLNVLTAIFSWISKQEWKYRTAGEELIDNIGATAPQC